MSHSLQSQIDQLKIDRKDDRKEIVRLDKDRLKSYRQNAGLKGQITMLNQRMDKFESASFLATMEEALTTVLGNGVEVTEKPKATDELLKDQFNGK